MRKHIASILGRIITMAVIQTGWTYKFSFLPAFADYDGVYTLVRTYSYDELFKDNISLYDQTYSPLKVSKETYDKDVVAFRTQTIYKLVTPDGLTERFIPEGLCSSQPLYPVQKYGKLVLFIPLGIYQDDAGLDYLMTQVSDQVKGALGITAEPKLTAVQYQYLTEDEYKQISAERNKTATKTLNFFTETVRQANEISQLKTANQKLTELVKKLGA
jgi:hypothetical protein